MSEMIERVARAIGVYTVVICGLTAGLAVVSWHLLAAFLVAS